MTATVCCWTTATCICRRPYRYSLLCRYFRNAVLPAEKELYADIFKQRTYHCAECGTAFVPNSNRQKYCPSQQKGAPQAEKRKRQKAQNGQAEKPEKRPYFQGLFGCRNRGAKGIAYQPLDFGFLIVRNKKRKDYSYEKKISDRGCGNSAVHTDEQDDVYCRWLIPQG